MLGNNIKTRTLETLWFINRLGFNNTQNLNALTTGFEKNAACNTSTRHLNEHSFKNNLWLLNSSTA